MTAAVKKSDYSIENRKGKNKFLIVTDSSSDITQEDAKKLGILVLPLSVIFPDGKIYRDGVDIDKQEFFEKLAQCKIKPPTTSLIDTETMKTVLSYSEDTDIVLITISSGMSGTYNFINLLKSELPSEQQSRVYVIDSETVTSALGAIVYEAIKIRDAGIPTVEAVKMIEEIKSKNTLYATIETLKYLQMGGRIRPTTAIIGKLLNIKPMITIKDKMVENCGKSVGTIKGFEDVLKAAQNTGIDFNYPVYAIHIHNRALGEKMKKAIEEKLDAKDVKILDIGCTVGVHVGPNAVGLVFFKK